MSLAGLISGVMGGAAKGYGQYAESELKKQQELDLRKQMLEAQTEKQLRIDEVRRLRDRDEETRKMSPEYLEQVGSADLTKGQIAARNRQTLAPENAAAATAEFNASAPLEKQKAIQRGQLAGEEFTTKVKTPGYTSALASEAAAKESPSAKVSASVASAGNSRAQEDFTRVKQARDAAAKYQLAIDAGDDAAAKAARIEGIRLGVDPASVKKGSLKVTKDDSGADVLVHEDDKGNVTRVDTNQLPNYRSKGSATGMPAPKTKAELDRLPKGTTYTAPDGTVRTKQ